jgi:hypothetical protein
MSDIASIIASRDAALAAIDAASNSVANELAGAVTPGSYRNLLIQRQQDLTDEGNLITNAATNAILALPSVIAAAAQLNALSTRMTATAAALPAATSKLNGATAVLSFGQQFANVIATAQK